MLTRIAHLAAMLKVGRLPEEGVVAELLGMTIRTKSRLVSNGMRRKGTALLDSMRRPTDSSWTDSTGGSEDCAMGTRPSRARVASDDRLGMGGSSGRAEDWKQV